LTEKIKSKQIKNYESKDGVSANRRKFFNHSVNPRLELRQAPQFIILFKELIATV